jgi:hypothetical protein
MPGIAVDDTHHITLPAALPSGEYTVTAGLYRLDTGQRLTADPPGPEPGSALVGLTSIP